MKHTFTDFSQLTKAVVKPPKTEPTPAPKAEPKGEPLDRDAAAVLDYFSRPAQNAPQRPAVAPRADPVEDWVAALEASLAAKDAALDALAEEKVAADELIADPERQLSKEREAHDATIRERNRLQGECGRLQGELRKTADKAALSAPAEGESVTQAEPQKPAQGLLCAPVAIAETFPGELREQVLATLQEGLYAAAQSRRDRRAEILRSLLAANRPSGELERRRAELKQILKDAGYFNDPKPLERLGFRLISGRTHWKLQYANVRVTMSKTPSDFRSNLNNAAETANRCF